MGFFPRPGGAGQSTRATQRPASQRAPAPQIQIEIYLTPALFCLIGCAFYPMDEP
jgi:hypothetical protein